MQQFDVGNRGRCVGDVLEPKQRMQTQFHPAVILLDDIVPLLSA
jgi:hypothetical protein